MNKEVVTYEQAIALKEIGFKETCFSFFNGEGELYESEGWGYTYGKNVLGEEVSAPLKQQVFKWFRDNGIDCSIVLMRIDGWNEYQYVIFTLDEIVETGFNTYEEAEEACIDKVIELVKNNNNE